MVDCHMHTPLCGHAVGEPRTYVERAAQLGLDLITFTCHIPMAEERFGGAGIRMSEAQLPEYFDRVADAREYGETLGVEVLCGIEAEIFPEPEPLEHMDAILEANAFDFVLGSLHAGLPAYREWLAAHGRVSDEAIVETYFEHLTEAVGTGRYDSFSHPDVVRLYGVLEGPFRPEAHEPTIRSFLETCRTANHCLEVNTSGLIKGDYVVHPDPLILDWAAAIGNRFTLGSDAHTPESVGQHFDDVLALLAAKGIHELYYFRKRVAVAVSRGCPPRAG